MTCLGASDGCPGPGHGASGGIRGVQGSCCRLPVSGLELLVWLEGAIFEIHPVLVVTGKTGRYRADPVVGLSAAGAALTIKREALHGLESLSDASSGSFREFHQAQAMKRQEAKTERPSQTRRMVIRVFMRLAEGFRVAKGSE
jgi:hypothetical protein